MINNFSLEKSLSKGAEKNTVTQDGLFWSIKVC